MITIVEDDGPGGGFTGMAAHIRLFPSEAGEHPKSGEPGDLLCRGWSLASQAQRERGIGELSTTFLKSCDT